MSDDKKDDKPVADAVPLPPVLPTPQEAAMNAAIIVSEMVDIDSESGAVIAAAAAAGAAIEAATAAKKADPSTSRPNLPVADGDKGDPVTTVKLSRERIVKALETEEAGPRHPRARQASEPMPATTPAGEQEPDEPDEDFDPVAIAAAAIGRLRSRAKTDLGQLRLQYQRHDGVVLLLALVVMIVAGRVHAALVSRR